MAGILPKKPLKKYLVGQTSLADFKSIQACFDHLTDDFSYEIYLLSGIYKEELTLYKDHVSLIGLGEVIISGNKYARQKVSGKEIGTFATSTFFINANEVSLTNLTIENTAGPGEKVGQAVALYLEGNHITVKNCRLIAFQDTLCLGPLPELNKDNTVMESIYRKKNYHVQETFFVNCYIEGTVDFIFGGGNSTFSHCEIFSKKRLDEGVNYLTAPSTSEDGVGFLFQECFIHGKEKYLLGRPWRPYGKCTFENCYFDEFLKSSGWSDWDKVSNRLTATFKEINNHYGKPVKRADWISFN